jgi:FG-GAP-like repeat
VPRKQLKPGRHRATSSCRPLVRLQLTELEDRTVPAPTGAFDAVTENGYLWGWVADPAVTAAPIYADVYVDGVIQSATTTNVFRPDVNAYLNSQYHTTVFTGNYGFAIPLPAPVLANPSGHTVQVYAVDRYLNPPTFMLIGSRYVPPGYAVITGAPDAAGSPIQIKTSGRDGGAISSLTWNGYEFINSHDQGRLLQSDYQAVTRDHPHWGGGLYNPTEGGSQDDSLNARTTSSSVLQYISTPQSNRIVTQSDMAFWLYKDELQTPWLPENPVEGPGANWRSYTDIPANAPYLGSGSLITKDVTIGYAGNNNIVQYVTSFTIPSAGSQHIAPAPLAPPWPDPDHLQTVQFAILDCFLQADDLNHLDSSLATAWTYDPTTKTLKAPVQLMTETRDPVTQALTKITLHPYPSNPRYPKIIASPDGRYAFAVVTDRDAFTSGFDGRAAEIGARYSTGAPTEHDEVPNPSDPWGPGIAVSMDVLDTAGHPIGGTYTFVNYVLVGSLDTVLNALGFLQATGHIAAPSLNGDGASDLLFADSASGANQLWTLKDPATPGGQAAWLQAKSDLPPTPGYIPYFGDFNGDTVKDILWNNPSNGDNVVWLLKHASAPGGVTPSILTWYRISASNWQLYLGDFDGNGTTDLFWRDPSSGANAIWLMQALALDQNGQLIWAKNGYWITTYPGTQPYLGDFNNDGTTDILWHRPDNVTPAGENVIWLMQDPAGHQGQLAWAKKGFNLLTPTPGAQPYLGDFNGDGATDILWHYPLAANGYANAIWLMQEPIAIDPVTGQWVGWAKAGYWIWAAASQPYLGDFNGDGTTDILWNSSWDGANSIWLMQAPTLDSAHQQWVGWAKKAYNLSGTLGYHPYLGDFDGDGRTDVLWRDPYGNNAIWLMQEPTIWDGTNWVNWYKNAYWIDSHGGPLYVG